MLGPKQFKFNNKIEHFQFRGKLWKIQHYSTTTLAFQTLIDIFLAQIYFSGGVLINLYYKMVVK